MGWDQRGKRRPARPEERRQRDRSSRQRRGGLRRRRLQGRRTSSVRRCAPCDTSGRGAVFPFGTSIQDEALFFHSRRKEKVRQETEAKRWPRRRRRKQRFEIMNEADERESMAALEQRDGSQVEGAVASATSPLLLKPAFFGRISVGLKKGPTRGPIGEGRCRQSEPARRWEWSGRAAGADVAEGPKAGNF